MKSLLIVVALSALTACGGRQAISGKPTPAEVEVIPDDHVVVDIDLTKTQEENAKAIEEAIKIGGGGPLVFRPTNGPAPLSADEQRASDEAYRQWLTQKRHERLREDARAGRVVVIEPTGCELGALPTAGPACCWVDFPLMPEETPQDAEARAKMSPAEVPTAITNDILSAVPASKTLSVEEKAAGFHRPDLENFRPLSAEWQKAGTLQIDFAALPSDETSAAQCVFGILWGLALRYPQVNAIEFKVNGGCTHDAACSTYKREWWDQQQSRRGELSAQGIQRMNERNTVIRSALERDP